MTYPKLLKLCLASSSRKKYDLSVQSQLLFIVSQKSAVDEVLNIIFLQSSISMLVVLILSKNNFMIVQFFDFLVFQSTVKWQKIERWNDSLRNVTKSHDQTLNYLSINKLYTVNCFSKNVFALFRCYRFRDRIAKSAWQPTCYFLLVLTTAS